MAGARGSRRAQLAAAAAAVAGAALFVWAIRQAGAAAVADGIRRVGAGIVVVCALGGVRGLIRAAAWRQCLDREHQIGVAAMFATYLAGDALGNVTPFGVLVSEPLKVVMVRRRIDVPAAAAALTIENLFYALTIIVMLVAGTVVLLAQFTVPPAIRLVSLATLALALAAAAAGAAVAFAGQRTADRLLAWLRRRRFGASFWRAHLPRIQETVDRIFDFVHRRRAAVLPVIALETAYHALAVAEIWYALTLITAARPAFVTAFVLEYVNRVITIGFQFVPMWLGVDEAGTSLATSALSLGPAAGVTLALVRKTRVALWTAIGIGLLLHRGLSGPIAAREAQPLASNGARRL